MGKLLAVYNNTVKYLQLFMLCVLNCEFGECKNAENAVTDCKCLWYTFTSWSMKMVVSAVNWKIFTFLLAGWVYDS